MQSRPTTLKDIAEKLGVSVSTVSRVLTEKDKVDPETRRRVKEALEQYHYVPNEMAQVLRGSPCRSIGMIVPTLDSSFYTRIITAAQDEAIGRGYTIMVCTGNRDGEHEKSAMRLLASKHLTGILCASELDDPCEFYRTYAKKTPIVFFDSDVRGSDLFGYIRFDAEQAARKLTEKLLAAGHRRIAMLAHKNGTVRGSGFWGALAAHGLPRESVTAEVGLCSYSEGLAACERVLERRPTAIFATNDILAYAAIRCLKEHGLRVPDDVSVVGFDACDPTGLVEPRLTCVRQDTDLIGREAVRMLLAGDRICAELPYHIEDGQTVKEPNIL